MTPLALTPYTRLSSKYFLTSIHACTYGSQKNLLRVLCKVSSLVEQWRDTCGLYVCSFVVTVDKQKVKPEMPCKNAMLLFGIPQSFLFYYKACNKECILAIYKLFGIRLSFSHCSACTQTLYLGHGKFYTQNQTLQIVPCFYLET